jgi:hypothetical protein
MALNLVSPPEIKAVSFLDSAKSTHFLKLPGARLVAAKKHLEKRLKGKAVLCCLLLGSNLINSRRLKSRGFFAWLL